MKDTSLAWGKALEAAASVAQLINDGRKVWEDFQKEVENAMNEKNDAEAEVLRCDKQISAANARLEIAKFRKQKVDKAIEHAEQIEAYMRSRFTNMELYSWRVAQLSTLYFQTYQLAYDLAKRAEKAFQYELGDSDTSYIRFGGWDNLKKGLLAGEQLQFDLRRMEKAYLDQNRRGYEIIKHISLKERLKELNVPSLLEPLHNSGECEVELEEALFDRDYPGHYLRRIKSVSLTVEFEGEPPRNVNCTLTLLTNTVRMSTTVNGGYARQNTDKRFRDEIAAVRSIVTSSGRDDSGLFVLDFEDDRYLPFEGAGAISRWRIEMPNEQPNEQCKQVKDIVLHLRYTARDGGNALKEAAKASANKQPTETNH